jgi:hypothetical protein
VRNYWGADRIPAKHKLPVPYFSILNGGNQKLQEFMVSPARPYSGQLRIVAKVYQKLEKLLMEKYGTSAKNLGDECGFAPLLNTPDEALTIIEEAIAKFGYAAGFSDSWTNLYEVEVGVKKTGKELMAHDQDLLARIRRLSRLVMTSTRRITRTGRSPTRPSTRRSNSSAMFCTQRTPGLSGGASREVVQCTAAHGSNSGREAHPRRGTDGDGFPPERRDLQLKHGQPHAEREFRSCKG